MCSCSSSVACWSEALYCELISSLSTRRFTDFGFFYLPFAQASIFSSLILPSNSSQWMCLLGPRSSWSRFSLSCKLNCLPVLETPGFIFFVEDSACFQCGFVCTFVGLLFPLLTDRNECPGELRNWFFYFQSGGVWTTCFAKATNQRLLLLLLLLHCVYGNR